MTKPSAIGVKSTSRPEPIFSLSSSRPSSPPISPVPGLGVGGKKYPEIAIRISSAHSESTPDLYTSSHDFRLDYDHDPRHYHPRVVHRSLEYDLGLCRRQLALIATQPMSISEEIDAKRKLLRVKAAERKLAQGDSKAFTPLASSKGSRGLSLSTNDLANIGLIGRSRSPSPAPLPIHHPKPLVIPSIKKVPVAVGRGVHKKVLGKTSPVKKILTKAASHPPVGVTHKKRSTATATLHSHNPSPEPLKK